MTERTRILIEAVAFEILGVLNYVLHTALYLPFIADLGLVDAALRRNLCDVQAVGIC